MSYLKPQTPIELGGNYIYPLTTADQVIVGNGNRLNSLFKKTIQETVILKASNWSETLPYTQTITLTVSVDDYKVDANVVYTGNENDSALNKAAGCLSYIEKNRKEITFYCLKNKPEIDIPVEITGTCRNTIATVEDGIKLNFDIKAYGSEEEMLADTPAENTIGIITDVLITGYRFSATEPEGMDDGEVWIYIGTNSAAYFDIVTGVTLYPISAKQMVSGALVDVTAKSYQGSAWVNWTVFLYKEGNEYESITGGWVSKPMGYRSGDASAAGNLSIVRNNDSIVLKMSSFSGAIFYTRNKIKLTGYKKIVLDAKVTTTNDADSLARLVVWSGLESYSTQNVVAELSIGRTNADGLFELPIPGADGEYYVGLAFWSDYATVEMRSLEIR